MHNGVELPARLSRIGMHARGHDVPQADLLRNFSIHKRAMAESQPGAQGMNCIELA